MRDNKNTVRIFQANVGHGVDAHDIALNTAYEEGFEIILIQEPWVNKDITRRITRRHSRYQCHSPSEDWAFRPRVLTYHKKRAGFTAIMIVPFVDWPRSGLVRTVAFFGDC